MRDYQRTAVYRWEDKHIFHLCDKTLTCHEAASVVNYIWDDLNFKIPPVISEKTGGGYSGATRHSIRILSTMMNINTVIHELAHSLNSMMHREVFDAHGPNYVADYCFLLCKYQRVAPEYLIFTLQKSRVNINETIFWNLVSEYNQGE